MAPPHELPELVQDAELRVIIRDNTTIHIEPLECRDAFSPQTWATKRTIGRGGDGTVFLQHKIEGPGVVDTIAVKQMKLDADLASDDHDSKRYVRELEALAKFAQGRYSRYFVRSYGWYQEEGWLYICMEYCKHLDLRRHIKTHGPLPEELARVIATQILQGLVEMHRNKIAHRDLKPANILIHRKRPEDDAWWVVLGDLGLSRRSGASSGTTTIRGTPDFMAPETIGKPLLGDPNSADPFPADMWSLGETISCTLMGHVTFSSHEELLRYQKRHAQFPDSALKASGISSDAIDFVRSLMDVDPIQRLTATQALSHPWIKASHTLHTHTTGATTKTTVHTSAVEGSKAPEGSENEPSGLEEWLTSSVNETTQASALWTETLPIQSSNTQTSRDWNPEVVDPGILEAGTASFEDWAGVRRGSESTIAPSESASHRGHAGSPRGSESTIAPSDSASHRGHAGSLLDSESGIALPESASHRFRTRSRSPSPILPESGATFLPYPPPPPMERTSYIIRSRRRSPSPILTESSTAALRYPPSPPDPYLVDWRSHPPPPRSGAPVRPYISQPSPKEHISQRYRTPSWSSSEYTASNPGGIDQQLKGTGAFQSWRKLGRQIQETFPWNKRKDSRARYV